MSNLTPYTRQDLFTHMRKEMDDMFGDWYARGSSPSALATRSSPERLMTPLDVHENDAEFVVRMDVPGVPEKDIKVSFQGDLLTIRGERRAEKVEGKGDVRYTERTYGGFTRSLTMPSLIKSEEIRARYKDGVIEIHLPKAQKSATREIKVEGSASAP